ncbi:MAG: hypothetical protein JO108_17285 [Acidobacteriaceae bacterium]|nr:hypothetical protein [Acidobacteriaceae bacterium]
MFSQRYLQAVLALIAGAASPFLYLHLQKTARAHSAPTVITLQVKEFFTVPVDSQLRLVDVAGTGTDLWFLLHGQTGYKPIRTDSAGHLQTTTDLTPTTTRITNIFAAEDGRLGVLSRGRVDVYSSSGSMFQTNQIGDVLGCTFLEQNFDVFSGTPNGVGRVAGNSINQIAVSGTAPAGNWPVLVLSLTKERIGIVHTVSATLHQVDVQSGVWKTSQLTALEIQNVNREKPTDRSVSPAIFAASVDNLSGDFFAAVASL